MFVGLEPLVAFAKAVAAPSEAADTPSDVPMELDETEGWFLG